MDLSKLKNILEAEPAFRYKQVNELIFKNLIGDWQEASNLSKDLRERLAAACPLALEAEVLDERRAAKALLTLNDGQKIESVLIKNMDGRNTVCVSSQVGCALGCSFCATGAAGFKRNLTTEEIVAQVLFFARRLKKSGERVDNVVFMGMGESFLNTENVLAAVKMLNNKAGLNIAARSISISTCGIPSGIRGLIKFPLQVNLALSLHAPTDALRQELMPIAKRYKLADLRKALADYQSATNRKVMIEYLMIEGVNDGMKQAEKLAEWLSAFPPTLIMINLIPYNAGASDRKYQPSTLKAMEAFKRYLGKHGLEATIRESLGAGIAGACGQLAGKKR